MTVFKVDATAAPNPSDDTLEYALAHAADGDTISLESSGIVGNSSDAALPNGSITIDTQGHDDAIEGGALTDPTLGQGALAKTGMGTLTLGSVETYTGPTTVKAGTLKSGIADAFDASADINLSPDDGATPILDLGGYDEEATLLDGAGTVTNSGKTGITLTLGFGTTNDAIGLFYGVIEDGTAGGKVSVVKTGAGTEDLAGEDIYSGGTTIDAGTLSIGNGTALGTGVLTLAGTCPAQQTAGDPAGVDPVGIATLGIDDVFQLSNEVVLSTAGGANGGIVNTSGAGTTGYALTLSGEITGAGTLEKDGGGTLVLSGDRNTYTGATEVTGGQPRSTFGTTTTDPLPSTLQGGVADAFGINSAVSVGAYSTLDLGGYDQAIGSLSDLYDGTSGTVTNSGETGRTLTVGGGGGTGSFSGTIGDGSKLGTIALNKVGTGTETLSGTDSYTGGTTVTAGTLEFATEGALPEGSITFAAPGATLALDATPVADPLVAFGAGDSLDLRILGFAAGATATLTGTTLEVVSGATEEDFTLVGPGAVAGFSVTGDGKPGTGGNKTAHGTLVTAYALPTISMAAANTATTATNPVAPFAGDTVTDPNGGIDTLTITPSGSGGTLAGPGLVAGPNGTYILTGSAATVTSALRDLRFTPTGAGAVGSADLTTFTLADASSTAAAATAIDGHTTVTDAVVAAPTPTPPFNPAPTPTPVSTSPSVTTPTPSPTPISIPTPILAPMPMRPPTAVSTPTLAPTPAPTTVPTATAVPTTTQAPPPTAAPTPVAAGVVKFDDQTTYKGGAFMLSGRAWSAAGIGSVEISAAVDDGAVRDLGAATVHADGTFTFLDRIGGGLQGFITATETDDAGATTSADADYALQGGLRLAGGYGAEQDRYAADGSGATAVELFKPDASQRATLVAPGQTLYASSFDTFDNGGQPESTFVFDPGHGLDVISQFRADSAAHDTLSFKGSDFSDSVATLLAHTHRLPGGSSVIVDPTTNDAVRLAGVTKRQLTANQGDFSFHG